MLVLEVQIRMGSTSSSKREVFATSSETPCIYFLLPLATACKLPHLVKDPYQRADEVDEKRRGTIINESERLEIANDVERDQEGE